MMAVTLRAMRIQEMMPERDDDGGGDASDDGGGAEGE